jgi:hypothetical protein
MFRKSICKQRKQLLKSLTMAKAVAFDHVDYVRTHGFTPANELAFEHCVRAARTLAEIHLARGCLVRAHIGHGTTCIGAVGTTVAHSAYVCVVFAREDGKKDFSRSVLRLSLQYYRSSTLKFTSSSCRHGNNRMDVGACATTASRLTQRLAID